MATPPRLTFGRSQRLKRPGEFARVKAQGQRLVQGCLILNWQPVIAGLPTRLGVITSGKLGAAVIRSRARRLLREAYRRHQHEFTAPADLVLVARQSIVGRSLEGVEKDFLAATRKAGLIAAPAVDPV